MGIFDESYIYIQLSNGKSGYLVNNTNNDDIEVTQNYGMAMRFPSKKAAKNYIKYFLNDNLNVLYAEVFDPLNLNID